MVREFRANDYFTGRPRWFLEKEKSGGGITMNYGAHALDALFYSSGLEAVEVMGVGSNLLTDDTVEAAGQILVKLSNGAGVSLNFCGCPMRGEEWDSCYHFTGGRIVRNSPSKMLVIRGAEEPEMIETKQNDSIFLRQLNEFVKMMKGEPNEMPTGAYSRKIIQVLEKGIGQFDI